MLPRVALAALLAALVALPAVAQVPPPPSPSVEVTAEAEDVDVSVERPGEVALTVENTSPGTGTPLDDGQVRTVLLEVTGAPSGWTAAVEPTSLRLGPGESGSATLRVQAGAEAGDQATLTVTAKLLPLGANAVPGVGPAVDPEATDSVQVEAHRDEGLTRDILEGIGPWIYVVFLALLAAALVTLRLVLSGRRVAVALRSEQREVRVPAGGRASVPVTVENLTKAEDTVVFQVSAVAAGWAAFLPVPELQLAPGAKEELALTVIASNDLPPGAAQGILVTATSAQAPRRPATLAFDATATPGKKSR